MANLGKADVIDAVAAKTGVSKAQAGSVIGALQDVVFEAVKKGNGVTLTGFVTFKVATQAARKGVAMGKAWSRPAGKTVKVRAGKSLKDAV